MTPMTQMTDPSESEASASSAARPVRKRSRFGQEVPADTVALYSAARAFLLGEWFGGALMVASFTLLYLFAFAPSRSGGLGPAVAACLAILALGTAIYLRSRTYYRRIGFDYAPKWHRAAVLLAGAAGIFWLLFALLAVLTWLGVPVLPTTK